MATGSVIEIVGPVVDVRFPTNELPNIYNALKLDIPERKNVYSRVAIVVRPFTDAHIIAIAAKATIRNREILNRSHYQFLAQHDMTSFCELIDLWVLEYAEKFATGD